MDNRPENVVITGAAGRIGKSIAEKFAANAEKYFVIKLDASYHEPRMDSGPECPIDVVDPIFVGEIFHLIYVCHGGINILVNVAGVLPDASPFVKTDDEIARKTMEVNLWGMWNCCKAVLPIMRAQGYGRIVNISSIAAQSGDPGNTAYAISKAAVEKLTKQLAIEAPYNKDGEPFDITVNAVAPGIVDTPMTANLSEKALQEYFKRSPLKRKIKPEEVAEAVYFLATASQAINGVILPVDGGYLAS